MNVDLWLAIRLLGYVQYETFNDGGLILVHVARAAGNDRHVAVPRVRKPAIVALNVICKAFENVSFADVCGSRLGACIPDHVDPRGADQFNKVDITKSLKLRVDRVHPPSPRFPECLLSHRLPVSVMLQHPERRAYLPVAEPDPSMEIG